MRYHFSFPNRCNHLFNIELQVDTAGESSIELHIPAWRPGRYELQHFAANIKNIRALDAFGEELAVFKTSRNCFQVLFSLTPFVNVYYEYFAYKMDAGGCWVDDEQVYLNFIGCALFVPAYISMPCEVTLELPENYRVACGLPREGIVFKANDYYQLVDSPLMASASLTHWQFECASVHFHIWIHGEVFLDEARLISDFRAFTEVQLALMGSFPESDYHYLLQLLPYPYYHGVEHRNSTVLTLGPASSMAESSGYATLLEIASHELFHAWNIIKIRPVELLPYDFTKENYFPTGFVAEGFTTYYGDLFLYRAGIVNEQDYLTLLNGVLKRHFDAFGNTNLSLEESSLDLWVDGYTSGIPNRKVSIYVKGCIVALLLDLEIQRITNKTKSLDDVMQLLWEIFGKNATGYSMHDVRTISSQVAGVPLDEFFQEAVMDKTDLKDRIESALPFFGYTLSEKQIEKPLEGYWGVKTLIKDAKLIISAIDPNSTAYSALSIDDVLVAVNELDSNEGIKKLCESDKDLSLKIVRWGRTMDLSLSRQLNDHYFRQYAIEKVN